MTPVSATAITEHVGAYRAGRALAECHELPQPHAQAATWVGWLILQPDVASRKVVGAFEIEGMLLHVPNGPRQLIAAACQSALAKRVHSPMRPNEAALIGALATISASGPR